MTVARVDLSFRPAPGDRAETGEISAKVSGQVLPLLAPRISRAISAWLSSTLPFRRESLEEIRVRKGLPLCLVLSSGEVFLSPDGGETTAGSSLCPDGAEIERTYALFTDCSSYAMERELAGGYLTLPGGHRVGIVGRMAAFPDGKYALRDAHGFNIRIARHVKNVSERVLPAIVAEDRARRIRSTLVISPPRAGKTTMLRDLARVLSEGRPNIGLAPCHVGVVDERSEIASCYNGVPQHDLGPRVDVLDGCPKAAGMMMLIRSMSPDVVVTDEIGGEGDAAACAEACAAGVSILASAHASDLDDLARRPYASWLVTRGYFEAFIVLSRRNGPGTVEYAGPGPCDPSRPGARCHAPKERG